MFHFIKIEVEGLKPNVFLFDIQAINAPTLESIDIISRVNLKKC